MSTEINDLTIQKNEIESKLNSIIEENKNLSSKLSQGSPITLFINVYAQLAELTLSYKENTVFNCKIEKVVSINKSDKDMIINSENDKK